MKRFKRNYYSAIIMMVLGAVLFMVSACEKDDDESPNTDLLIGSWLLQKENDARVDYFLSIEFERDGDYSQTFIEGTELEFSAGEWEVNGNRATIDFDDGDRTAADILTLTEDRLIVFMIDDEDKFEFEKD